MDRTNVAIAKLTMSKDLPGFDNAVFGFGAGLFFWGYFLLEIPGTLLVEKWSARKWICRIMITWGIRGGAHGVGEDARAVLLSCAFCLGLAEAGFFPGVIVYLTHWFPGRDRTRALSLVSGGHADRADHQSENLQRAAQDRHGRSRQWRYDASSRIAGISKAGNGSTSFWGIPAVVLGVVVSVHAHGPSARCEMADGGGTGGAGTSSSRSRKRSAPAAAG